MPDERTGGTSVGPGPGETADRSGLRAVYYIAAAVLALLVPLILLAGIWIRQEFTKTQRDLEEYLEGRATALSQRVEAEIQQEITVLQAIAALPSLDEPNLPEFHREAARMIAAMPQWAVIGLVDVETGKEVVNTLRPVGTDPPDATAPDDVKAVAAARRPSVRTRLPESEGLFSDHAIFLYVPVIRDGAARYVLVAGARAATIQTILGEQADDPRVLTVVVDESDRILARSRAPDEFVTRQANPELRRSTAGRPGGLFAAPEVSSQDVFTAFRRSPTTGWLFVVATDRQQFDRLAQRSTLATIATASLALTLAVILAVFLFYNVMERRVERRAPRGLARAERSRCPPPRHDPGGARRAAQGVLRARGAAARDLSSGEEQPADRAEPPAPRLARPRARSARRVRERDPAHRRDGPRPHAALQLGRPRLDRPARISRRLVEGGRRRLRGAGARHPDGRRGRRHAGSARHRGAARLHRRRSSDQRLQARLPGRARRHDQGRGARRAATAASSSSATTASA